MMRKMMDIPTTQNLLNDSHIVRNVMMNNMRIGEAIGRNLEFAYIINNPDALR